MRTRGALLFAALTGCLAAPGSEPAEDQDAAPGTRDAGPTCDDLLPGVDVRENPDNGHCYFVTEPDLFQPVAIEECGALGAHLVQVADQDEADFVVEKFVAGAASQWIGLMRDGASWRWVTGEPLGDWSDFEVAQTGDGDCVELFTDPADCADGCWNDLECEGHSKSGVCEIDRRP